jgi:hypothetical protein
LPRPRAAVAGGCCLRRRGEAGAGGAGRIDGYLWSPVASPAKKRRLGCGGGRRGHADGISDECGSFTTRSVLVTDPQPVEK